MSFVDDDELEVRDFESFFEVFHSVYSAEGLPGGDDTGSVSKEEKSDLHLGTRRSPHLTAFVRHLYIVVVFVEYFLHGLFSQVFTVHDHQCFLLAVYTQFLPNYSGEYDSLAGARRR